LKDYAVLGMVMLLFYRATAKTTFIACIILLLAIPAVDALNSEYWGSTLEELSNLLPLYQSHNPFDVLWYGLKGTIIFEILNKAYLYNVHLVMIFCMLIGFTLYKIKFFANIGSNNKYVKRAFWISLVLAIAFIGFSMFAGPYSWAFTTKHYSTMYPERLSIM